MRTAALACFAAGPIVGVLACGSTPFGFDPPRYHPAGFVDPALHGPALNHVGEDCRGCHGAELTGGRWGRQNAPSCDGCHPSTWRTDCVFCHGGVDNRTGAPPRDLSGAPTDLPFRSHTAHVADNGAQHAGFACGECHSKATDVLTPGHVFDREGTPRTPGRAEVTFAEGLSAGGAYAEATCADLYCHGNGRRDRNGGRNGVVRAGAEPVTCTSCHKTAASSEREWQEMSGEHARHFDPDVRARCADCHGRVIAGGNEPITAPDLHVNGTVEVSFPTSGVTYGGGSCSGICHGEEHRSERWR